MHVTDCGASFFKGANGFRGALSSASQYNHSVNVLSLRGNVLFWLHDWNPDTKHQQTESSEGRQHCTGWGSEAEACLWLRLCFRRSSQASDPAGSSVGGSVPRKLRWTQCDVSVLHWDLLIIQQGTEHLKKQSLQPTSNTSKYIYSVLDLSFDNTDWSFYFL